MHTGPRVVTATINRYQAVSGNLDRQPSQKEVEARFALLLWADGKMGDKTIPETLPKWDIKALGMSANIRGSPRGHLDDRY